MIRAATLAAVLTLATGTAAEAQMPDEHPTTKRYTMVMARVRVMSLAALCGLRPREWIAAVDEMIGRTASEIVPNVSNAMSLGNEAGMGAFWGGLVLGQRFAERERETYGQQACDLLASSDDLKAVDLLVGYTPTLRQAPQRQRR